MSEFALEQALQELRLRNVVDRKIDEAEKAGLSIADVLVQVSCTGCGAGCDMCARPCWGTPEDMQKMIDAGYGNRIMLDYFYRKATTGLDDVKILCPATRGFERKERPVTKPIMVDGRVVGVDTKLSNGCTFFKNKLCGLHEQGLKPLIGKTSCCKQTREYDILAQNWIVRLWDTETGRTLTTYWVENFMLKL